jgi:hypothetical protein
MLKLPKNGAPAAHERRHRSDLPCVCKAACVRYGDFLNGCLLGGRATRDRLNPVFKTPSNL